jgi:H/ACA ribonucleoprotein complex subunit 4
MEEKDLKDKILILDKPAGITSHDACDEVKRILNVEKAGHAGTLDPDVTGVLVIAMDNSVKILRLLSGLPKGYIGEGHLHQEISLDKLEKAIQKKFIGKILQTPPKRSRVKRVEREREIFDFEVIEKNGRNFSFKVLCQAGTYIRKLLDDLGNELGIGAHMTKLRRHVQGPFLEQESITVENLKDDKKLKKSLFSMEEVIKRLGTKTIKVTKSQEQDLKCGRFLSVKDFKIDVDDEEIFVALNSKGKMVALVKKEEDKIRPERVI